MPDTKPDAHHKPSGLGSGPVPIRIRHLRN